MSARTKAERSVDELAVEARKLRNLPQPSKEQRARLWLIETHKLPAAWRAVHQIREATR
jgi:hypothetical protein